jgi:hypothetical protein
MKSSSGATLRACTMTFRARPHKFSYGLAPTGRARCRGCKGTIGKGELRLVTRVFIMPGRSRDLVRHAGCMTAALAKAMIAAHGSLERVPASADVDAAALAELRSSMSQLIACRDE